MSERPDLRDLLGEDLSEAELAELRRTDELLRATPPAPEVPESLTSAVLAIPARTSERGRPRRRAALALAAAFLAAALAAGTFGIGLWVGGGPDEAEFLERVTLMATDAGPAGAEMVIGVLPRDPAGNWAMLAEVSGLQPLPEGGYYELWLTKGEELAASCGRFIVDDQGGARDVWLNGPYVFEGFDRWVVTAHWPGEEKEPWLLDGPVIVPA